MSPGKGEPLLCNVPTKLIVSPLSPMVSVVPDPNATGRSMGAAPVCTPRRHAFADGRLV